MFDLNYKFIKIGASLLALAKSIEGRRELEGQVNFSANFSVQVSIICAPLKAWREEIIRQYYSITDTLAQ